MKIKLFIVFVIIFMTSIIVIQVSKNFSLLNENKVLKKKENIYIKEVEIKKKTIGNIIDINEKSFLTVNDSFSNDMNKIIIVPDINSCKPCFESALNYYFVHKKDLNYLKNTEIILIIPSRNIEYARQYASRYPIVNVILADTKFYFREVIKISDFNSIVLLLDKNNLCLYSYLLEPENHYKIEENSISILNLIRNKI